MKLDAPMLSPDFAAVLRDIQAAQEDEADRIAALRDQRADLQADLNKAAQRLMYADLDKDRREWTESERDELRAAEAAFDEAHNALALFKAVHHHDLKVTP